MKLRKLINYRKRSQNQTTIISKKTFNQRAVYRTQSWTRFHWWWLLWRRFLRRHCFWETFIFIYCDGVFGWSCFFPRRLGNFYFICQIIDFLHTLHKYKFYSNGFFHQLAKFSINLTALFMIIWNEKEQKKNQVLQRKDCYEKKSKVTKLVLTRI